MKIAVWHNLPSGGGKRALYDHVRGLLERGHFIESWCPPTADQNDLPLSQLVTEHVVDLRGAEHLNDRERSLRELANMDVHCRTCSRQIAERPFDVLFANTCWMFRVPPIGRYTTIPRLLYLQEPYRWFYEALPGLPWVAHPAPHRFWSPRYLKSWLTDWSRVHKFRVQAREELISVKTYDKVLANSLFSRESLLRAYGLDTEVCYLGIDTGKFVDLGESRSHAVIGVGAIVPEKNIEFVIEALSYVREPRPTLIWIGNVGYPNHVKALEERARAARVSFVPKLGISDAQLVELYNSVALMAYSPRLEPFGYAPLEANACGVPVVAVAEGGVRETVVEGVNGRLVPGDPLRMARAIEELLTDPAVLARMRSRGRELVLKRWGLPAAIDRIENALLTTIEKRSLGMPS